MNHYEHILPFIGKDVNYIIERIKYIYVKVNVMKKYKKIEDIPEKLYRELIDKANSSPYRQNFHIEGNTGFINDPNGCCYFDGKYHLFHQWGPLAYSKEHWLQGWYHWTSTDLVNWDAKGPGLIADSEYETHGSYSGSGLGMGDHAILFYTGNTRQSDGGRIPYQIIAHLDKNNNVHKKFPPVIKGVIPGYTAHFRDPKIWLGKDKYYAVIGTQRENLTGTVTLFSSKDLNEWNFEGEIETPYKEFGYMWECPNYLELDDKGILIFCPQGLKQEGNKYCNIYQCGYLVGNKIDSDNHILTTEKNFVELDKGFDFYAAQVMQANGRTILYGWMGISEMKYPTEEYGYCGCLTMPRELQLKDNKLIQLPLPEIKNNRRLAIEEKLSFEKNDIQKYRANFATELKIKVCVEDMKGMVKFYLMSDKAMENKTELILDFENNIIELDRSNSGKPINIDYGSQRVLSEILGKEIVLDIFIDRSSLEIFIDNGEIVASSRIFPEDNQKYVYIVNETNGAKIDYEQYDLDIKLKQKNVGKDDHAK